MTETIDSTEILSKLTQHMKYAKYISELKRRETSDETWNRNMTMHIKKYPKLSHEIAEAYRAVKDGWVLPSMRSAQFAGRPIELTPSRIFNCAYLPMSEMEAFSEIMFLLLGGTGVGYSVQRHHVAMLPPVMHPMRSSRFVVGDSIEGWADAVKVLVAAYLDPNKNYRPLFDLSDVRPKGARLITSGGKAPGPEPLRLCLEKLEAILRSVKNGNRLSTVQVHDMVCIIADAVLAGGIRRAALIALFSKADLHMLLAKSNFVVNEVFNSEQVGSDHEVDIAVFDPGYGMTRHTLFLSQYDYEAMTRDWKLPWYHFHPHRGRANNSVTLLRGAVSKEDFETLWQIIQASGCGEPGFYWTNDLDLGTNPCCEVSLRPYQFCNLTTGNSRICRTQAELDFAIKQAAFIGTLQAGYTNFHYLRPIWKETTEDDALLGVSMTGVADQNFLQLDFEQTARTAVNENARVAALIGINPAARVTVLKPEGTTSLVLGTSSGVHAWHNDFYVRRIRVKKNESIYGYLSAALPELVEDDQFDPNGAVICIPMKAPDGAITRHESALDLLNRVKLFSDTWIKPGHRTGKNTNNVSATISVRENEWQEVGQWMWDNKDSYNGLSVLPYDGGTYIQAPFTDCDEAEYERLCGYLKHLDLTQVNEDEDETNLTGEMACAGGACSI